MGVALEPADFRLSRPASSPLAAPLDGFNSTTASAASVYAACGLLRPSSHALPPVSFPVAWARRYLPFVEVAFDEKAPKHELGKLISKLPGKGTEMVPPRWALARLACGSARFVPCASLCDAVMMNRVDACSPSAPLFFAVFCRAERAG